MLHVHGKQRRSCLDGQLFNHTVLGQASRRQFTSILEVPILSPKTDNLLFLNQRKTGPGGSVVKHLLRDQEVVGWNPSHAIPKAFKNGNSGHQALASLLPKNIALLTLQNLQKKSQIIINVCIHWRTVWKVGSHAKYVILLKYRDYYYYAPNFEKVDGAYCFWFVRGWVRACVRGCVGHTFCTYCNF